MNLKELPAKKTVKLLALVLTSLLIASVSAAMYYSLTMTSTITVYQADVYFVAGSDNGTSGVVLTLDSTNTTATITGLRAYPNMTFTYENVTRVRNNGTSTPNLRLAPDVDPSGNAADFEYVKFMLNTTNVGDRKWLNYTSNGSTWSNTGATGWVQISATTEWAVQIITKATWNATATNAVTIGITVDVD